MRGRLFERTCKGNPTRLSLAWRVDAPDAAGATGPMAELSARHASHLTVRSRYDKTAAHEKLLHGVRRKLAEASMKAVVRALLCIAAFCAFSACSRSAHAYAWMI